MDYFLKPLMRQNGGTTQAADIYNYNPWVDPQAGTQPYYNPFDPNLGYHLAETGPLTSSPISTVECPEGYVKDEETNTCVPIEVAIEAVKSGDRDKSSFSPVSDGRGGFISFADMFDGGGAGRTGPTFQGGIGNLGFTGGLIQKGLNKIATPYGQQGRGFYGAYETQEHFDNAYKDDEGKLNDKFYEEAAVTATNAPSSSNDDNNDWHDYVVSQAQNEAALGAENKASNVSAGWDSEIGNTGGQVGMLNKLVYRQDGGVLPGAIPPAAGPTPTPAAAPAPPVAPQPPAGPPPRRSFAEKVAEAKKMINQGATPVPVQPVSPGPMMVDGQGDGPVEIMPGAGEPTMMEVGPDMGPDTVDTELMEGSMVMNPEASEMYGDEIRAMCRGGVV